MAKKVESNENLTINSLMAFLREAKKNGISGDQEIFVGAGVLNKAKSFGDRVYLSVGPRKINRK